MKSIIIYATKYGCAEKAANMLKSKLDGEAVLVNIAKGKSPSLDGYDTVILGGSIYIGKIQKALANYARTNLPALMQKRVGLFICAGQPEPVRTQELEQSFPAELYAHAAAKDVFGHEYRLDQVGFLDKFILRKVAGVTVSQSELSEEKIARFAKIISGIVSE